MSGAPQSRALPKVALSVRQPCAWLIAAGHKDIENRTWKHSFRGEFLIHAGKTWDTGARAPNGLSWPAEILGIPEDVGGIVGVAEVVDCVSGHGSPWFVGPYGFVIRNARLLPFMPMKGQLGFFKAEYDVSLLRATR